MICPACNQIKKNLNREIKHLIILEDLHGRKLNSGEYFEPTSKIKEYLSSTLLDMLNNLVREAAFESFVSSTKVKECMCILSHRGDTEIEVKFCCSSPDNQESQKETIAIDLCEDCSTIIVCQKRKNLAKCCQTCTVNRNNINTSDLNKIANKEKRVQADSTTQNCDLDAQELTQKALNQKKDRMLRQREICSLKKQIEHLKHNLEQTAHHVCLDGSDGTDFLQTSQDTSTAHQDTSELHANKQNTVSDEPSPQHKSFIETLRDKDLQDVTVKNKDKTKAILREGILELFKESVTSEGKGSSYEFDEGDVSAIVNSLMEQMTNVSKKLHGKDKQCRLSHQRKFNFPMPYALWSQSASAYRTFRATSDKPMPCERTLQRVKQENRVKDGRDIKTYQLRQAARQFKDDKGNICLQDEYGILSVDHEMKLKQGIIWNSQTGEAYGLAEDMLDLQSILRRFFSEEGNVIKPAEYVNQWMYTSFTGGKLDRWMCSHFFNDGSLTGTTLHNQFNYVVWCCESIGSRVYGVCLDAGGNNRKFAWLLRMLKKISETTYWVDDECCYGPNIWDPSRRLYVWFCNTHGLKAMRNQLLASKPGGSKNF
jgi:hypothetical protein